MWRSASPPYFRHWYITASSAPKSGHPSEHALSWDPDISSKYALSYLPPILCGWTLSFESLRLGVLEFSLHLLRVINNYGEVPSAPSRVAFCSYLLYVPTSPLPEITVGTAKLGSLLPASVDSSQHTARAVGRLLYDVSPLVDVSLIIVKSVIYWITWSCCALLLLIWPSLTLLLPPFILALSPTSPDTELAVCCFLCIDVSVTKSPRFTPHSVVWV